MRVDAKYHIKLAFVVSIYAYASSNTNKEELHSYS